jgi:hypothetical protein
MRSPRTLTYFLFTARTFSSIFQFSQHNRAIMHTSLRWLFCDVKAGGRVIPANLGSADTSSRVSHEGVSRSYLTRAINVREKRVLLIPDGQTSRINHTASMTTESWNLNFPNLPGQSTLVVQPTDITVAFLPPNAGSNRCSPRGVGSSWSWTEGSVMGAMLLCTGCPRPLSADPGKVRQEAIAPRGPGG